MEERGGKGKNRGNGRGKMKRQEITKNRVGM